MIRLDKRLSQLFGKFMPSTGQGTRLKLAVYEGSLKQRFEKWGRAIGPEPRAQLGLGTSVLYISPPLIHVRLPGRIKEPIRPSCFESPTARDSCGYGFPLILFSKGTLFQSTKFSCHYCLMVRESKRRACRLSLAFVGFFVNRAYLLLIKRSHALFCSYKQFSLEHSFTFSLLLLEHTLCRALTHQPRIPFFLRAQSKFSSLSFFFNFFL